MSKRQSLWTCAALSFALAVVGCESSNGQQSESSSEKATQSSASKESEGNGQEDESMADKMQKEHEGETPEQSPAVEGEPSQPVTGRTVEYGKVGGETVSGYFAEPEEAKGDVPGIVVIHEWWGLNDNIRKMTDLLAGEGYAALAVDLYGGDVAEKPARAKELMKKANGNKEAATANLKAARSYLADEAGAPKIGVIGWCFGGGWALQAALSMGDAVDAAVVYYGQLVTDEQKLDQLEAPLIGFFGSDDDAIPVSKVRTFKKELDELDKEASVHIYAGAGHAFANPSGDSYEPESADDAWEKTVEFLAEHL